MSPRQFPDKLAAGCCGLKLFPDSTQALPTNPASDYVPFGLHSFNFPKALRLIGFCFWDQTQCTRIGVSNYELPHLKEMKGLPDILQIEFHPWWNRVDLLEWCRARTVKLVAYSSLGGATGRSCKFMQCGLLP